MMNLINRIKCRLSMKELDYSWINVHFDSADMFLRCKAISNICRKGNVITVMFIDAVGVHTSQDITCSDEETAERVARELAIHCSHS